MRIFSFVFLAIFFLFGEAYPQKLNQPASHLKDETGKITESRRPAKILQQPIRLVTIEQVASGAGPVIPSRFVYKGIIGNEAIDLITNPDQFNAWVNGSDLSSVSVDDGGQFYISQGGGTDIFRMIYNTGFVWSSVYELRFGADDAGLAWDGVLYGTIAPVPFTVWDLNSTPDDPTDDIQMIPMIYSPAAADSADAARWGIREMASLWTDNPAQESDWIYIYTPTRSYNDLNFKYDRQQAEGRTDPEVGLILEQRPLARITVNSLDSNPLTTINTLNGLPRPGPGTTIRWSYEVPPTLTTFRVDMRDAIATGIFRPADGDTLLLEGTWTDWNAGNLYMYEINEGKYFISLDLPVAIGECTDYMFVIKKAGGETIGEDFFYPEFSRSVCMTGKPQILPYVFRNTYNKLMFQVDMSEQMQLGNFQPERGDYVLVRGYFNGWYGNQYRLFDPHGDNIYRGEFDVGGRVDEICEFKYVIITEGAEVWEDNITLGEFPHNRQWQLTGKPQELPVVYFNEESPPPGLILTQPNGGEVVNQASYRTIRWNIQNIPDIQNITIEYSLDGGTTYNLISDTVKVFQKVFQWFVPDVISQQAKTRVIVTDINSNSYADESDEPFEIHKVDRFVDNTGSLAHTIRGDGTSGNTGISSDRNPGEPSLEFPAESGHHNLFISDLIMGTVPSAGDTVFLMPFSTKYIQTQELTTVDHTSYIETTCHFTDVTGLGLDITQKTYALAGAASVIFAYTITNTSGTTCPDLIIGTHNDFDLNVPNTNLVRFNADNKLAYMLDGSGGWTHLAGVSLFSEPVHSFRRYSGAYGPQSAGDFYRVLTAAVIDDPTGDPQADYRVILSGGPRDLAPAASTGFAFALVAGNSETELINATQQAQNFWLSLGDQTAPVITGFSAPTVSIGNSMTVSANISDNSGLKSVRLFYRTGGAPSCSNMDMNLSGSTYQATLPAGSVTDCGVEIRIEAVDLNDNLTTVHHMLPVAVPDGHAQVQVIGGTGQTNYQMISVPMAVGNGSVDNVLVDDLGAYDNTQWRLFSDNGTSLIEYPNTGGFAAGHAFWIISRTDKTVGIPAGTTVQATDNFMITLHDGWNQIASPYNFDVGWSDIEALNSPAVLDGPFFYRGTSGYSLGELISPFDGCYINNLTGGNLQLRIPFKGKDAAAAKPAVSEMNWQLKIRAQNGQMADLLTTLGMTAEASDTWDRYDHLEPPPVGAFVSAYFPHRDWEQYPADYAIDFRPLPEAGCIWDLNIKSNIPDKNFELSFVEEHIDLLPGEFMICLVDPAAHVIRDLRSDPVYRFSRTGQTTITPLKIVVGTEQFISEKLPDLALVPRSIALRQNFPNPFNPVTQITYELPSDVRVDLTIYDLNGRMVKQLQRGIMRAGYHTASWDGTTQQGRQVASGVYVYTLSTENARISRKMLLLR